MTGWMVSVPAIVILGVLSGWLSNSGDRNPWFAALRKPPFMPPGWLFPVAWTTLYILMGIAVARVWAGQGPLRRPALILFGTQLLLNLAWSPLFFRLHRIGPALALIVILLLLVAATAWAFAAVDRPAAAMLLPYLAWLGLATALNLAILRLNPGA